MHFRAIFISRIEICILFSEKLKESFKFLTNVKRKLKNIEFKAGVLHLVIFLKEMFGRNENFSRIRTFEYLFDVVAYFFFNFKYGQKNRTYANFRYFRLKVIFCGFKKVN